MEKWYNISKGRELTDEELAYLEDKKIVMKNNKKQIAEISKGYKNLILRISDILEQGRKTTYQAVNSVLTTTYWHIGRQIVEFEQGGKERAEYGSGLLQKIADDLTKQFGKGFLYRI